ncbi:MAG: SRPBCC family protein [Gemmatimonadota bacterium]
MPKEFKITREVLLEATPEQVWESIATEAGLAAWFQPMPVDPASELVVAWEPGRRLAIRTPEAADGSVHAFEYLIEARGGGSTVLRFVHSGFAGDDWGDEYQPVTAGGWDMYLHTLAQYHAHFPGRRAVYVEAEGPASSAVPEAWPALLGALGTGGQAEAGSQVRIELPGAGPIDGVIDYATANFLGLRTPDALIRFHGRWGLGMTVAVSHHAYGATFDAEAARRGWTAWLDQALTAAAASPR